jgi:photosystem II stability/assembly factor-like uncharacterized protein
MMKVVTRCIGIVAASFLFSATANANGRFPRSLRLVEDPNDANHLSLAATFGMVVTSDRGRNWYHICESAFSHQDGYQGDPLLSVLSSGNMLVDVQASVNVSTDRGCQWTPSLASSSQTVADFTVSPSNPNLVLAVVITFTGGAQSHLQQSTDGGATWTVVGTPLPAPLVYTLDVDHADPTHIFASALSSDGTGLFLRSTDRGTTWTSSPIPKTGTNEPPYIAAVDPHDSNKIFIRTDASPVMDGIATADDALLYSADGGQTWTEILRNGGKLLGFALSPDGSTVLAGYGDPQQAELMVDDSALGLYASPIGSFSFSHIFPDSITCLTWTSTGLYACTLTGDTGFELGFAPDANLTRCPLTSILRLSDIRGTLPGCASAAATCDFSTACSTIFQCADAGTNGMPAVPSPGCAVAIGPADAGKSEGGAAGGGGSQAPMSGNDSGGCALAGRKRGGGDAPRAVGFLAALMALVRARSARDRRAPRSHRRAGPPQVGDERAVARGDDPWPGGR